MGIDLKEIFGNRIKIDSKVRSITGVFFNEDSQETTDYKPSYQRNYVWDDEKATYFIESIFLGTEIPPLVYYKTVSDEAIRNEIIDGRQRYQSILRFIQGDLRLKKSGLQLLGEVDDLVGKTFSELSPHYKAIFQDTKIRVIEYRFLTAHTAEEEDRVKKEIFQRYNSGITPLKSEEISKAQYYHNDLNSYLRHELKNNKEFDQSMSRVFRLEKSSFESKVAKVRELLVLNKIPIKYFAAQKQKVIRKYFELMSDKIDESQIDFVYEDFRKRLMALDQIEKAFSDFGIVYNRLVGECLYWAISIVEMEKGVHFEVDLTLLARLLDYIKENIDAYTTVRSSFMQVLIRRYECTAKFFHDEFNCDFDLYLYNNDHFKKYNRQSTIAQESPQSFDELRINKPEPTSVEVSELMLNIKRNRFLIRPPYQRNEVRNRKKSSSIIESLLLGIMLPPIFVYKREDGVSEVIDGQQRLLSIIGFVGKPYKDENFNEQYSLQNEFALDLKDNGILKDLHNKRFCDLKMGDQNKILSSDIWVIDIKESNNKNFDPVDLFVRLNNKPYPISKDSFEMWNSFASRKLIDTIKDANSHHDKWFYMRKNNARMDNENMFTTLAYFQYLYIKNGNAAGEIVPERTIELYKIDKRINCRFRMRYDITKLMEQEDQSEFIYAINILEFGFIHNVKAILSVNAKTNSQILSKELENLLSFESNKRTQMMFYVLWMLLHDLSYRKLEDNRDNVVNNVKEIVSMLSNDSDIDKFKGAVRLFRQRYSINSPEVKFKISDVAEIFMGDGSDVRYHVDMVVDFHQNPERRFSVQNVKGKLQLQRHQVGLKFKRQGIDPRSIECVLKSRLFYFSCTDSDSMVKKAGINYFMFPFVNVYVQKEMSKILQYTELAKGLEKNYFERFLDLLVYEQVFSEDFKDAKIDILGLIKLFPELNEELDENRRKILISEIHRSQSQPEAKAALILLKAIDMKIIKAIEKM